MSHSCHDHHHSHDDKITRFVENGLNEAETFSPMDPPKAYEPLNKIEIPFADFARPLQILVTEHEKYLEILDSFEKALGDFRTAGFMMNREISKSFGSFFEFVDTTVQDHNKKEEKHLFPLLHERLIAAGECSPGLNPTTPTDVMEDEHLKVSQTVTLVFNLLGLGAKLKDESDRRMVFEHAVEQGREIVETMKLHIFRENTVLFPLAQNLISAEEFRQIGKKLGLDSDFAV